MTRTFNARWELDGPGVPPWDVLGVPRDVYDWVRFTRVENLPGFARRPLSPAASLDVLAELARTSVDQVERVLAHLAGELDTAADALSNEPALVNLDRIAFPGARLVAVGDSITADRLGWAEILSTLISRRSNNEAAVVNAGLSGSTSTDTVERLDTIVASDPDAVILMIGTNDVRAQKLLPHQPLVSAVESARNLRLLVEGLTRNSRSLIVVTSPPLHDAPSQRNLTEGTGDHSWDSGSLDDVVDAARAVAPSLIDLREPPVFDPADQHYMDADGVHPTVHGHVEIVRRLLTAAEHLPPLIPPTP